MRRSSVRQTACSVIVAGMLGCSTMTAAAATYYNSAANANGDWFDTATWAGQTVPVNGIQGVKIVTGSTVTASSVNPDTGVTWDGLASPTNMSLFVAGTLNISADKTKNTRSAFTNVQYLSSVAGDTAGTININGGAVTAFSCSQDGNLTTLLTINVTNGGSLTLNYSGGSPVAKWATIVVGMGGTYTGRSLSPTSTGQFKLNGGTYINNYVNQPSLLSEWKSGEVIIAGVGTTNYRSNFQDLATSLSSDSRNVLSFASTGTVAKHTLTSNSNYSFSVTQGNIIFNVYSSGANDCDLISVSGTGDISMTSDVLISVRGVNLTGTAESYVNKVYRLINEGTPSYGNVLATLNSAVWTISGQDYNVTFTNNLSTNGTLTVASITAVPEPAAFGMTALGCFAMILCRPSRGSR